MKRRTVLAGISAVLLGGVMCLTGCGGSSTTFSANWYKNTSITTSISGTSETLTYSVSLTEGSNSHMSVSYGKDSSYTVNLTNTTYSYDETSSENAYLLTSSLSVNVTYTVGEETASYTDVITSKIYFSTADNALRPMYSYKEFSCHSPTTSAPVSLEEGVKYYHYSFETKYDSALSIASLTYTKLDGDTSSLENYTEDYKISSDYTYLDNEELLFAIRGMTISSSASTTVKTLNASRNLMQEIQLTNNGSVEGTYKFDMGEEMPEDGYSITANKITVIANDLQSGSSQTAYYAVADADSNSYRGVMLSLSGDLPYNLGTINYTLTKAEFSTK